MVQVVGVTAQAIGATLPVSEVYGPVFQGEGAYAGRRVYFVRLGLCNLRCSWCDTPYTWDTKRFNVAEECPPMTPAQIVDRITDPYAPVVLSGGEPLIHQHTAALAALLAMLPNDVHVETNGTTAPNQMMRERVAWWSVSPKLHDQGDPVSRRIHPSVLREFAALCWDGRAAFKVVCRTPGEVAAVTEFADELQVARRDVWIMPEGTDAGTIIRTASAIEDTVLAHGFNLTLRQHVLLHGSERLR